MTHIIKTYIATATIVLGAALMAACSSGSEESGGNSNPIPNTTAPLSIRLAVPETDDTTSTKSRIGDPGADGDETAEWDRLTVIVAFTEKKSGEGIADNEPQKMVYWDTFTRAEFDNATDVVMHTLSKLSPPNSSGYHDITMYLPQGKCNLYAVTYSKGAGLDIEKMLSDISKDGQDHNADVQNLNIAGNYGSGNAKQMQMVIGVGTGYAVKVNQETGTAVSPEERTMEVKIDDVSGEKQYWRLIVQRLAAKIDLQWDSQYAYELNGGQYDYIGVTGYEYHTGKAHPLFPTLTTQTFTLTTELEQNLLKMDDTEISQHNGKKLGRPRKRKNEKFEPEKLSNGETLLDLLTHVRYPLLKSGNDWTDIQKNEMKILFELYPRMKTAYGLVCALRNIFKKKQPREKAKGALEKWAKNVGRTLIRELISVRDTIIEKKDYVLNYFNNRSTNASAESFNSKMKGFRAQVRGVADMPFFMYRMVTIFG